MQGVRSLVKIKANKEMYVQVHWEKLKPQFG